VIVVGLTFWDLLIIKHMGAPISLDLEKQGACHNVALPLFTLKGILWQKKKIMKTQVFHHRKI